VLSGISVAIQGIGNVGRRLASLLVAEGARVILCDVDRHRAESAARELGGELVDAAEVFATPCDVFSPCAVGAILNEATISQLKCRIVAGSANNMLATPEDGERLHERGILYVPDYVINAGGAIALGPLLHAGEEARIARVDEIAGAVAGILAAARQHNESPAAAVRRRVQRVLEEARARHV